MSNSPSAKLVDSAIALAALISVALIPLRGVAEEEQGCDSRAYVGVAASVLLPQGGAEKIHRAGGAALRAGVYCSEFFAAECEAASLENAAGFAAQGLWHWQGSELYGRLFGYSVFDPFFTFGARGWLGHGVGQVGPKAGLGSFWHLTEEWSLRAEADATLCIDSDESVAYSVCVGVQRFF